MKFHEIHVGQAFIPLNRFATSYTKTGHSTATAGGENYHFSAMDEVDSLQRSNKHPQPISKYPIPPSDHVGGISTLGHAMQYLSQDARRNFHESPYKRDIYQRSTGHAMRYLRESFDALESEHNAATNTP